MLAFPDASALGLAEAPVPLPYHGPSSSPRLHQHRHQQHGKADARQGHFGGVHSHQQRKSSIAAWAGALGKGRSGTHVCSALGFSRGSSGFDEEEVEPSSQFEECRRQMAQYVRTVDTEAAHQFVEQANSTVVIAMKQTVANLVGTLPPQYFDVKISTVAESLAQLFLTVMTTGYMFRSAQYRMELSSSLSPSGSFGRSSSAAGAIAAGTGSSSSSSLGSLGTTSSSVSTGSGLFSSAASDDDTASTLRCVTAAASSGGSGGGGGSSSSTSLALSTSYGFLELESQLYAPGVQKSKVEGEVMRWHLERGLERMPAVDYISALEAQVSSLRRELAQRDRPAGGTATMTLGAAPVAGSGLGVLLGPAPGCGARNDLLEYVKGLDPRSIKELTAGAGSEHVKEAMQLFIARLLGISDKEQLRSMSSEFTSAELSQVLFWLMVVGYTLRTMEVRSDLSDSLDL